PGLGPLQRPVRRRDPAPDHRPARRPVCPPRGGGGGATVPARRSYGHRGHPDGRPVPRGARHRARPVARPGHLSLGHALTMAFPAACPLIFSSTRGPADRNRRLRSGGRGTILPLPPDTASKPAKLSTPSYRDTPQAGVARAAAL